MSKTAYSYIRFSSGKQKNNTSKARQTDSAEEYCVRHGFELADLSFKDLGVSSKHGANWMDTQEIKDKTGRGKKISQLANFYMGCISGDIETPCIITNR